MLRLWIVTSSLFVASFCEDVNFYFGETCFSKNDNLKLTAVYTGSGTVTAVQWYYSNKTGTNLFVIASSCSIAGGLVPEGYPDESRMTLGCDEATKTFNLTLDGILEEELDKSWGATFSLSGDPSPDVKQMPISVCLNCKCECDCECRTIVIVSIVFGIPGALVLLIVIGGLVTGCFDEKKTTLLVFDGIGIVSDVLSLILSIVVKVKECCEENCECCEEDSECCNDWIDNAATAFIVIPCVAVIASVVIFVLVKLDIIGPGRNAYKAKEAKHPDENHGMTGTSM